MIAIVNGCFGLLIILTTRYLLYRKLPVETKEKLRKIFNFTDLRKKTPETFETLWLILSILSIAFGLVNHFYIGKQDIPGILDDIFSFFMLFGPGIFVLALAAYLKRKYW